MILAHSNGMMCACRLVKENPKSWIINYNDKAFPKDVRVEKSGNSQLFNSVDEAFAWLGGEDV